MNATNRTHNGTRHAEFMAISSILSPSSERKFGPEVLKECDMYVTVEPCIMCASLLRQFGIRKVFFGATNERFGGTGGVLSIHRRNGAREDLNVGTEGEERNQGRREREDGDYEVSGGWLREESIVLLRRFYVQENSKGE